MSGGCCSAPVRDAAVLTVSLPDRNTWTGISETFTLPCVPSHMETETETLVGGLFHVAACG